MALLRSSSYPSFSELALQAISALICAECNAVTSHNVSYPQPVISSIFHTSVISDEVIPSGAFLIVIRDTIDDVMTRASTLSSDQIQKAMSDCISTLFGCLQSVFGALQSCFSSVNISWEDPRSSIAEAWFLTMTCILKAHNKFQIVANEQMRDLLKHSFNLFIHLVMSKTIEKEYITNNDSDGSMSVDGPQSLAILEFLEFALKTKDIGPTIFALIASNFQNDVNLDVESVGSGVNAALVGGALISASLFRAASGGLPPWTIEYVPDIFSSLFEACGGVQAFCRVIQGGTDLRVKQTSNSTFGVVCPGKKVAGYFFDQMKPKARDEFLQKTMEICQNDDGGKWRTFKVLLKANCGKIKLTCLN